ncbi:MAG: hypothetical protein IKS55_11710 [Oscillospiraceae bacterium]|nr:hypothetical protein [Oscillospiraceae bacterium]
MQTIRIHFQDLSFIDVRLSETQTEEFERWMRFANQSWTYSIPGQEKEIKRKDISRTEKI